MYEEKNILKAIPIFRFFRILLIVTFLIAMLNMVHSVIVGRENMSSGYVTNKEIIYQNATYFRGSVTDYVLYFEGEYTNAFDKQTAYTKKIYVSEEIYNSYNIGDYFNSQNIIEKGNEEKEQ